MAATDVKTRKRKRVAPTSTEEGVEIVNPDPPKKKKAPKAKASKKDTVTEKQDTVATIATEVEDQVDEDDQTAALLAGFESDSDAEDPEEDIKWDEDDIKVPNLSKTQRKALEKADKSSKSDGPGVIYIGRVPRGFFEPQMKKYFTQFGTIKRLRLSRNKKTGASKHYAFVEFASAEVADIVARTMDNYLMFGHILKCKVIPAEQVHENLFKGANTRFKVDPKNKKVGKEMERGVTREKWEGRVERENEKRRKREEELVEVFGYEYKALEVRSVDDVPRRITIDDKVDQEAAEQLLVEAGKAVVEELEDIVKKEKAATKKNKAGGNTKAIQAGEEEPQKVDALEPAPKKKLKKGKAAKENEEPIGEPEAPQPAPQKKTKKVTKKIVVEMQVPVELQPTAPTEPEKKRKAKVEPKSAAKPKKAKKAQA